MQGKRLVGDVLSVHSAGGGISFHQIIGNRVHLDSATDDGRDQSGIQVKSIYGKTLCIHAGNLIS